VSGAERQRYLASKRTSNRHCSHPCTVLDSGKPSPSFFCSSDKPE
jgi:hypothetical protein